MSRSRMPWQQLNALAYRLSGLSKSMGATADTGQFASCGYDTVDAIRKSAPRLRMVHLKDVQAVAFDRKLA
jgi:sugar phosphate isomerase/epimerase